MVVLYQILFNIEPVVLLGFAFTTFWYYNNEKQWKGKLCLGLVIGLFVINLIQIPMAIQLGETYGTDLLGVIGWLIVALCIIAFELRRQKK